MDRLSIFLSLMTGTAIAGALVIAAFTFGYYGLTPILVSALIGVVLAWPVAHVISRRIKRRDPDFDHTRAKPKGLPDPNAREV